MDSDSDCYPQNMRERFPKAKLKKGKRKAGKRKGVKETSKQSSRTTGYCMKCQMKRKMVNAHRVVFANGQPAMAGKCEKCGTKMNRFIKRS